MKHLFIGLTAALILVACNSRQSQFGGNNTRPEPEMIFGNEKKQLQSYIAFLDSVKAVSNDFIVDTTLFQGGSYIYIDSLGDENPRSGINDMIAQTRDARNGIKSGLAKKELEAVLKGKSRFESYSDFLTELKETRYLAVLKNVMMVKPKMQGSSSFESGGIVSLIQVVDLKAMRIVKYGVLQAENSNEVSSMSGMSEFQLEQDLWNNYSSKRREVLKSIFN